MSPYRTPAPRAEEPSPGAVTVSPAVPIDVPVSAPERRSLLWHYDAILYACWHLVDRIELEKRAFVTEVAFVGKAGETIARLTFSPGYIYKVVGVWANGPRILAEHRCTGETWQRYREARYAGFGDTAQAFRLLLERICE